MSRAVRLAVGSVAGALLVSAVGPQPLMIACLTVGAIAVALWARRWLPIVVGLLLVVGRASLAPAPATVTALPEGSGPWVAVVASVGSPKAGDRPAVLKLESPALIVAATLPWYPEVAPGDRVQVEGTLEAPPLGDYGDYLRRVGASATLRSRSLELVRDAGGGGIGPWEALRRASASALDRTIPAPEAGLADGILVGLRDHVDRDLAAAFTTAGVSHIIAISGWNIAIVATTLGALTGRLGRRRRTVATCLAIGAYVAFVGPSPSVVRAAAMAACALLARDLGRPTTASAAMGLAVTGLLLLDPGYVDDAGFRLSVLATAGLIVWGTGLSARLAGAEPGRLRAWLAESLGVSLAAQAATLPIILLDFGRLSIVSPVVNVIVAPLVAPAMAAGGLALGAGLIATVGSGVAALAAVATIAGLPAWFLLGVLIGVVRAFAGLPFASVGLEPPANAAAAAVAALAIGGVVAWHRRRRADSAPARTALSPATRTPLRAPAHTGPRAHSDGAPVAVRRAAGLLLATAVIALAVVVAHRPDGATRITVLDVGQGDAILLEGGRGGRLLIDGGPDPARLLIALGEHLPPWDRRIDAVVLTHPHEDHVAGLAALLARYRVGRVFEPGMIGPGPGYAAWAASLEAGGPTRWSLATGDRLTVDDVDLQVLWPDAGSVPLHPSDSGTSINNVSIVLLGRVQGHAFLLAGDVEQGIDPTLLTRSLPHLDLLKVAHHGSGTSSTQPFLDATQPKVAIVSVGAGNPYGHPAPATMARLHGVTNEVFRTDLDGSVTVTFDGAAERVHASGGRPKAAIAPGTSSTPPIAAGVPGVAGRAGTGAVAAVASLAGRFSCGIPPGGPIATVGSGTASGVGTGAGSGPVTVAATSNNDRFPRPPDPDRPSPDGRYHPRDDRPDATGGSSAAPLARPSGMAPPALPRRGRGRGVARAPYRGARDDRPPARGVGRAPP
jgi:competence protein ComEC